MKERLLQMADLYDALLNHEFDLPRSPLIRLQMIVNPREPGFDVSDVHPDDVNEFSFHLGTIHEKDGEVIEESIDLSLENIPIGHA